MNIVIVAKTRMSTGYCVGGLILDNNQSIRLLPMQGHNQPENTPFNIGDVWDLSLKNIVDVTAPHMEDVRVVKQRFVKKMPNLKQYLSSLVGSSEIHPGDLFDALISFTGKGSGYISQSTGIPSYSTGFWRFEKPLHKHKEDGKTRYVYRDNRPIRIPYVGLGNALEEIPSGTLLRFSLARWWKPDDSDMEERCYLQLSGWYL